MTMGQSIVSAPLHSTPHTDGALFLHHFILAFIQLWTKVTVNEHAGGHGTQPPAGRQAARAQQQSVLMCTTAQGTTALAIAAQC